MFTFLRKLGKPHVRRRIVMERLTEPLHVNVASMVVALCGSMRARIAHDLIIRPHNAYGILYAADQAKTHGIRSVSILEFGVAAGAGLMNMAKIAALVGRATGVDFKIYGFDTGRGMPPPGDYRDHPDLYATGDFPMDESALRAVLPPNATLVIGDVAETVPSFLEQVSHEAPVGYVVIDVDHYHAARDALAVLKGEDSLKYLPLTLAFLDDVALPPHNSSCGELLAVNEFNAEVAMRKIERDPFLADRRVYRRADWIKQMYSVHVLDHPSRCRPPATDQRVLDNPYL